MKSASTIMSWKSWLETVLEDSAGPIDARPDSPELNKVISE